MVLQLSSTNNHVVMCTVFAHFFIFSNRFTQSGLNNEQSVELHTFLTANDVAPRPFPPPSARPERHRKTDKGIGAANIKIF